MSDESLRYPPDLLAEGVRELLDASPSDLLPGLPAGQLRIERAWLPIYPLANVGETVLSILPADDSGERLGRNFSTVDEIEIGFSIQKKLDQDPQSDLGKAEITEVVNFAQRCLVAAFTRIVDAQGTPYAPQRYQRTIVDETLVSWNQFTIVFSITYKAAR